MAAVVSQRFGYWSKPRSTESHGCIEKPQSGEAFVSPPPGLAEPPPELKAPPGLEHMVGNGQQHMEPKYAPLPAYGEMQAAFAFAPAQYKVLLQHVPEMLLKECLLGAMFEQARLKDVVDLTFRSNGRAFLTLTSENSMTKCIRHFNGRKWACSEKPVVAFQVRTVPSEKQILRDRFDSFDSIISSASTASGRTLDDASVSDDCASEKDSSIFSQ
jgi:hypothetical protein